MIILHIVWGLPCGGIENMLVDIVNEQVKTNKVSILVINNIVSEAIVNALDDRVNVHFVNRDPGSRNPFFLVKLHFFILLEMPKVMHLHAPNISKFIHMNKLINAKLFCTSHAINESISNVEKFEKVFSISNAVRDDLKCRMGIDSIMVHNGINPDEIKSRENTTYSKGIVFRIVQLGRLYVTEKGQDILIEALNELVYTYGVCNVKVDFIGDGPSENSLKKLVDQYHLTEYVQFLGGKERAFVYKNLSNYDLLIQPSRYEGFGLTVVEAMVAKTLALVSDIDGPSEIVNGGEFGFMFQSGSPEVLASQIKLIIESYNDLDVQNIISNACEHARKSYNVTSTARRYLKEYSCG